VAVTAADQRYMQSYFGTSQQSTTSGAEPYRPSGGLRDTSVGISLRGEVGERWIGFVGAGYSVLLGPARDSPGIRTTGWGINGGLAWKFWW
jgi:outer membrane scaffolding protein for murein synthesis (MipA/OmpV family)